MSLMDITFLQDIQEMKVSYPVPLQFIGFKKSQLGCADPKLYEKTFMFAFFIYAIIFNSLNTRSEKFNLFEHIGENKNFVLVMGAIFVLQTIIIEIGGKVFNTTLLEPKALLVSMVLAVLIIPVDLIRKAIMSR